MVAPGAGAVVVVVVVEDEDDDEGGVVPSSVVTTSCGRFDDASRALKSVPSGLPVTRTKSWVPLAVTTAVTSYSTHVPELIRATSSTGTAARPGRVFHVKPVSVHDPGVVLAYTAGPSADPLLANKRRRALVTVPARPLTAKRTWASRDGSVSTSRRVAVPRFVVGLAGADPSVGAGGEALARGPGGTRGTQRVRSARRGRRGEQPCGRDESYARFETFDRFYGRPSRSSHR